MTAIRLASWAERTLGVKIHMREMADEELSTLDDAALLLASKVCAAH